MFERVVDFVNPTTDGKLKDMSTDMAANYNPRIVESAWDSWWEQQGYYSPDNRPDAEPFVIAIPPPNVTGTLHLGHALMGAMEDALARYRRMQGHAVLWLPGFDHAGIATQTVVERKLYREGRGTRHEIGREPFLQEVWKWVESNRHTIRNQLRRIGSSVDWSRTVFTMDETRSKAVSEAFVRMFNEGYLYRSNRIVNWSCSLATALSNIEVDYIDVSEPTMIKVPNHSEPVEFGVLHSFAYKLKGNPDREIVVATTRIETMLGDSAVAVHPDDERYKDLHGAKLQHPFVEDREITIITDAELVDMKFGTGAVKITPAHDPNDFECGLRHELPQINILDENGLMNENAGPYQGMKRFEVRSKIIKDLEAAGLYRGKQGNVMKLGLCSRSGDVIEPVVRPQWWVKCNKMAARAVDAVKTGKLKIVPADFEHVWFEFLEEPVDWCVSRQLWWGHRIPAYRVVLPDQDEAESVDSKHSSASTWIAARSEEEARVLAAEKFPNVPADQLKLLQDEDVLDTWFSSGLFPFSIMGWPEKTADLARFFPTSVLETGHDILFFWVARMVMMSLTLTDQLPFDTILLHAMVRDKNNDKMSKSKGNVIDPNFVIHGCTIEQLHKSLEVGNLDPEAVAKAQKVQSEEYPNGIAECGADALRFALIDYSKQPRSIALDPQRIVGYRRFGNKLWHTVRFALYNLGDDFKAPAEAGMLVANGGSSALADRWILSRLHATTATIANAFEEFSLADATAALFQFWRREVSEKYLELLKPIFKDGSAEQQATSRNVLYTVLTHGLRLLHPFMPFISEELWHRVPDLASRAEAVIIAPYPKVDETKVWFDEEAEQAMSFVESVTKVSLATRAAFNLTATRVECILTSTSEVDRKRANDYNIDIITLGVMKQLTVQTPDEKIPHGSVRTVVTSETTLVMPTKGLVDVPKEIAKFEKEMNSKVQSSKTLAKVMSNPSYVQNTDPATQAKHKANLEETKAAVEQLQRQISDFEALMDDEEFKQFQQDKLSSLAAAVEKANKEVAAYQPKVDDGTASKKDQKKHAAASQKLTQTTEALEQTRVRFAASNERRAKASAQ
jgi:valyl-tRNA synthetase